MSAHDSNTASWSSQAPSNTDPPKAKPRVEIQSEILVANNLNMDSCLQDVRQNLSKKATFEQALADLQQLLNDNPDLIQNPEYFAVVQRSFTLLKSRYTAPAFWSAGRKLYQAVEVRQPRIMLDIGVNLFLIIQILLFRGSCLLKALSLDLCGLRKGSCFPEGSGSTEISVYRIVCRELPANQMSRPGA